MEVHFVVIEPKYAKDRTAYEEAGETVCREDVCQIGFFSSPNDVPAETLTADFFSHGGWEDRHETALFFRNTNSGVRTLQFDCGRFAQAALNDCLLPIKPTADELAEAQARGVLSGFGRAKFGMSTARLMAVLGGSSRVRIVGSADARTVVKASARYHRRSYDAFFNVTSSGFSTVLMKWSGVIDDDACAKVAKEIASDVSRDFGKEDSFSYYDADRKAYRYRWLFADGAAVELNRLALDGEECGLDLHFSTKEEAG